MFSISSGRKLVFLSCIICCVVIFYSSNCIASNWKMMLDGHAIPMDDDGIEAADQIQPYYWNPYTYKSSTHPQIPKLGYHKDAEIYYHVSQLVHRFDFIQALANVHFDVGVMGYMTNQFSDDDGSPRIRVFPLISLGINDYALKLGYSPEKRDLIINSWFVQMDIWQMRFW